MNFGDTEIMRSKGNLRLLKIGCKGLEIGLEYRIGALVQVLKEHRVQCGVCRTYG